MKSFFLGAFVFICSGIAFGACEEPKFAPLPEKNQINTGFVIRAHPSGDFVILTGYGENEVAILDLRYTPYRVIKTPFNREPSPVEPDWLLIASADHPDGMRYYNFWDIVGEGSKPGKRDWDQIKPVFSDNRHDEFYHSSGTLESTQQGVIKFRSLLWSKMQYKDYSLQCSKDGVCRKESETAASSLCEPDILNNPQKKKLVTLREQQADLEKETEIVYGDIQLLVRNFYKDLDAVRSQKGLSPTSRDLRLQELNNKYTENSGRLDRKHSRAQSLALAGREKIQEINRSVYGISRGFINQPKISLDAKAVSGSLDGTHISILEFNSDGTCTETAKIDKMAQKASFSHSRKDRKGFLTFSAINYDQSYMKNEKGVQVPHYKTHVYVFNRDNNEIVNVSESNEYSTNYPGFTQDGRLIYLAEIDGKVGLRTISVHDTLGILCPKYKGLAQKVPSESKSSTVIQ